MGSRLVLRSSLLLSVEHRRGGNLTRRADSLPGASEVCLSGARGPGANTSRPPFRSVGRDHIPNLGRGQENGTESALVPAC